MTHRVQKELKQLQSLKPHGIEVNVPSDSLQVWEAIVPGPDESHYKGDLLSHFLFSSLLQVLS